MTAGFRWCGVVLPYFDHEYNDTRLNMRRIEVPIARWHILNAKAECEARGCEPGILEVGNVLSHYGPVTWPVVDLRERGAINVDVIDYEPEIDFDLIVSISTVEHMDHNPAAVISLFRSWLAPTGLAFVTVPTKRNGQVDKHLRDGTLGVDFAASMCHQGSGTWWPCPLEKALEMPRDSCAGKWHGGMVGLYIYGEQCDAIR